MDDETKCQEAPHASAKNDDARSLYKTARELTGSRPNMSIPVKNVAPFSEGEKNAKWVEHFSEVLNKPIPTILLDLDDDINNATDDADNAINISKEEIKKRLRALANTKAADLDFTPAELLKLLTNNGWQTDKNFKHSLAYCKSPWW